MILTVHSAHLKLTALASRLNLVSHLIKKDDLSRVKKLHDLLDKEKLISLSQDGLLNDVVNESSEFVEIIESRGVKCSK